MGHYPVTWDGGSTRVVLMTEEPFTAIIVHCGPVESLLPLFWNGWFSAYYICST